MITYNGIIAFFKKFADKHMQINSFSEGDLSKIELKKINEYPILHVLITSTSIEDATIIYNLDVYILTGINNDEADEWREDSLSNTLLIMQDLRTEFFKGKYIVEKDLLLQGSESISCTPIDEQFNNRVYGWSTSMSVTGVNESTACNIPYPPTLIYNNYVNGANESELTSPITNMKTFLWWSANIDLQAKTTISQYQSINRINTLQATYYPDLFSATTSTISLSALSSDFCEYDITKGGIKLGGRNQGNNNSCIGLMNSTSLWIPTNNTSYFTNTFAFKISHIKDYNLRAKRIGVFNLFDQDSAFGNVSHGLQMNIRGSAYSPSPRANNLYVDIMGDDEYYLGDISDESNDYLREEELIVCIQINGADAVPSSYQNKIYISVNGGEEQEINVPNTQFVSNQKYNMGIGSVDDYDLEDIASSDFIFKDLIAHSCSNITNAPNLQDLYRWLKNK